MGDETKPALGAIGAIKAFFQRVDKFAPNGGREVTMGEFKLLSASDRTELGKLCLAEMTGS